MSSGILMGNAYGIYIIQSSLTPTSVATITSPEQTFTVPGLRVSDTILSVIPPLNVNGVSVTYGRVSAADTLALKFVNPTAGGVVPAAGAYVITVARPESGVPDLAISD